MRKLVFLFIVYAAFGCSAPNHTAVVETDTRFQPAINDISAAFAPDARTVMFNVRQQGNVLFGETTSAAAKAALLSRLDKNGFTYLDSIVVLPRVELQHQNRGVVTLSVATLRTEPSHKAELATQATLGTTVHIFKRDKNWLLVQTPDNYLAWIESEAITRMDSVMLNNWLRQPKLIFTQPFGFAYSTASGTETVTDLVYGDVMSLTEITGDYYRVRLPDNRQAFIKKQDAQAYEEWRNTRSPSAENFVDAAKQLTGIPYLWGGTSFKAVDCSGFTKTVYFMNGLVLPRDASQQVHMGTEIDTSNNWKNLQPGDLLFFGPRATASAPERVVHVGMWIGNGQFIHASGKVRVSSLDPSAANYDAHEHHRFLKVKRIPPEACLYDLRNSDQFQLP